MPILLENFIKLCADDVHKSIMKLQTESCESDPIPMHILKDDLDSFLPMLSKFINLSLNKGVYCDEWKVTILELLLKKLGLDLNQVVICHFYQS